MPRSEPVLLCSRLPSWSDNWWERNSNVVRPWVQTIEAHGEARAVTLISGLDQPNWEVGTHERGTVSSRPVPARWDRARQSMPGSGSGMHGLTEFRNLAEMHPSPNRVSIPPAKPAGRGLVYPSSRSQTHIEYPWKTFRQTTAIDSAQDAPLDDDSK